MKKAILLVDCYAFYCSCERAFQPHLKNFPIGVLSNNDGCVISRTRELKSLGVAMGEPYFKVRHLMKEKKALFFSANFELYTDLSIRVFNLLKSLLPKTEVYSIDEAFAEIHYKTQEDLLKVAKSIKQSIFSSTRIPVRIGIGQTKTLAKLSIEVIKLQNDCFDIFHLENPDQWLKKISIHNVWGIGRKKALTLNTLGVRTAFDLKYYLNESQIQKYLTKTGRQTQDELRGICCSPVLTQEETKKGISVTRSFGEPVYEFKDLLASLSFHIVKACEKLREQNSLCQEVSFFCRTSHFGEHPVGLIQDSYQFLTPTNHTGKIIEVTSQLLKKNFKKGLCYKKSGVFLSQLHHHFQPSLFQKDETYAKQRKLMEAIDQINTHYGSETIFPLSCLLEKKPSWAMRQEHLSPRYTSSWSELPQTS